MGVGGGIGGVHPDPEPHCTREEAAPRAEVTGGGGGPADGGRRSPVGEEDQRTAGGGCRWGRRTTDGGRRSPVREEEWRARARAGGAPARGD